MKHLIMPVAFLAILSSLNHLADAKYPREGPGIGGTVTSVSPNYFMMDLDDGGYLKVFCTPNTNFQLHGRKSDSSHVKKGVRVRVTGTTDDGSTVDAYKVNVVSD